MNSDVDCGLWYTDVWRLWIVFKKVGYNEYEVVIMSQKKYPWVFVMIVFAFALMFSGASCDQQSTAGVPQRAEPEDAESRVNNISQPRKDESEKETHSSNSVEAEADAILSSELEAGERDQASVSSKDEEDRFLVTFDADAFGDVGALGSEDQYEENE